MCGGVEAEDNGKKIRIYFPNPKAALPVRLKNGETKWVTWGKRKEEPSSLPQGGWARLQSIQEGKWQRYRPVPVVLVVDSFMEKDQQGQSHWFPLQTGQLLQGLVARYADEQRVYVVTVETPPEYQWLRDRWPRLVRDKMP